MLLTKREIKPNLIVSGILEEQSETRAMLMEKIQTFFKNIMLINSEIEINDAYR